MDASHFDVAPFALPNTPDNEVRFEEPRDIAAIEVAFDGVPGADVAVSYLRKTWPGVRIENTAAGDPCALGWVAQDDWFNVEWSPAAIAVEPAGAHAIRIRFQELRAEFPGNPECDVPFRRTLGIRIDATGDASVTAIRVFTTSPAARSTLRVECDNERFTADPPGGDLSLQRRCRRAAFSGKRRARNLLGRCGPHGAQPPVLRG